MGRRLESLIRTSIVALENVTYIITLLIIAVSIVTATYTYVDMYNDDTSVATMRSRINLAESFTLALSFILGIEILKLYYIKSYKQLSYVVILLVLKLVINYFLDKEVEYSQLRINQHKIVTK